MLPMHRTTRNGRPEYDDEDKYTKRSWSAPRVLKSRILRKPLVRVLLVASLLVTIYILYTHRTPRPGPEVVERWQQNGGKYDAGNDPRVVRDEKNNEVIQDQQVKDAAANKKAGDKDAAANKKAGDKDAAAEPPAGEPLKFPLEDEADWQIMNELLDDDTVEKQRVIDDTLHVDSRAEPKYEGGRPAPKQQVDDAARQKPFIHDAEAIPQKFAPSPAKAHPASSTDQPLFVQTPPFATLTNADTVWASRQQNVVAAFQHAWKGYATDAFGKDEYRPLSHSGHDWLPGGIGLMIVDALDTMMLMGLPTEYAEAREWVATKLNFNKNGEVNLFETTIRVLGGLLSAYHLSGSDKLYLDKAVDLADRLMGAFQSPSGIPYSDVNLAGGARHGYGNAGVSSTAEVTTLQLEFKYLSYLTGDKKYWNAVEKVMKRMKELESSSSLEGSNALDGLVPIFINPQTGRFSGQEIRLGSRGDSYYGKLTKDHNTFLRVYSKYCTMHNFHINPLYPLQTAEYLLKQYLQTSKTEPLYRQMYDTAVSGIKSHLVAYSHPSNLLFMGELLSSQTSPKDLHPKMDHLVCFLGGNLALGATEGRSLSKGKMKPRDREDLFLGQALTETCFEMYNVTATGLAPEIAYFERGLDTDQIARRVLNKQYGLKDDIVIKPRDAHCLLRPETVESLEWGWKIFQAFEQHTKLPGGGYAALNDVTEVPSRKQDRMDTFFLAETLKYLYLLFSPKDIIPLEHYVFNTEAHPLPIFKPQW
ncbi:glycoside hydrolase [Jimgerdemannia flammicorona]|uniref:alpha-1,2-Mannosidase n=1 Tax=Jimgerdemannia flammicorona TaxID=994334 RepID=A0A433DN55_9FUNG|nr:glycoside hydrolase [Jimgerdemannia flammicorona]